MFLFNNAKKLHEAITTLVDTVKLVLFEDLALKFEPTKGQKEGDFLAADIVSHLFGEPQKNQGDKTVVEEEANRYLESDEQVRKVVVQILRAYNAIEFSKSKQWVNRRMDLLGKYGSQYPCCTDPKLLEKMVKELFLRRNRNGWNG